MSTKTLTPTQYWLTYTNYELEQFALKWESAARFGNTALSQGARNLAAECRSVVALRRAAVVNC